MSYNVDNLIKLKHYQALGEMVNGLLQIKQDLPVVISTTVGTSTGTTAGTWVADNSYSGFNYHYDIEDSNTLATDIATVNISPESESVATACGLSSTNRTLNGVIRLYSKTVPTSTINVEYILTATYTLS